MTDLDSTALRWQAALAAALVGESLALPESGRPDVARLLTDLAAAGWTSERIGEHARAVVADERPWPHPIPVGLRFGQGAAQLHASLGAARVALGLASLEVRGPSQRTKLNADEQRLLRDVPPHHGS